MTRKRVMARNTTAARRKAGGKRIVVTKVKMVKGGMKRKGMKSFAVTTKKKKYKM